MATPYVVQKVALSSSNSGFHPDSQGGRANSNYYQCRFAYPNWCPVCETRKAPRCGRRRSKSEGLEADPLRERNRLCESRYDVEHWRKRVVKEYDLCSYQQMSHFSRQTDMPQEVLYHASLPQPMDVDSTLAPVKKFKEHFLLGSSRHYHRNYDNGYAGGQHVTISEVNENPKHCIKSYNSYDPYTNNGLDRGQVSGSVARRMSSKVSSELCRNRGSNCDHMRTEVEKHYENNVTPHHGLEVRKEGHYSGENCRCEQARTQNGDGTIFPSSIAVDATAMQDRYFHEVEILRSKLRHMKGGAEGKRMRQRSESEPGAGFGTNGQESAWEAKRARDDSPDIAEYLKDGDLYAQHRMKHVHVIHAHRHHKEHNSKLLHLPVSSKSTLLKKQSSETQDDETSISSDSDFADSERTCVSGEDGDSKGEPAEDSEEGDDQSVLSSLTTLSNDSNTPSVVGETLGSISLNDNNAQKKGASVNTVIDHKGLPQCLRTSLFSHVPPYISFSTHDVKVSPTQELASDSSFCIAADTAPTSEQSGEPLPPEIQRHMKWKLSTITPLVIRRTLVNSGFRLVRKSNDWCGTWGKHMKSLCFKTLKDFQKINHFPGTFQIGRKDRLWKNLYRLMTKFGKKEFGFIPRTYVLPQDSKLLRQAWEKSCGKEKWIIKPPASARGTGIKVVHRWAQIPKKRPLVVQKYISQPYLINGSKFDLRLYVLVTSINPLRIYIYDDGLVRFASVKYSGDMASLNDRYMHLTNYSINKMSSQYTQNEDASACQGHKWTVKTLWTYLEKEGVDVTALWNSLVDLVIKTIISGESSISQLTKANLVSRYCSYELFGIDVLLDESLKPWLLEVNISPSLHSSSPLDLAVKGPMVRDLLNMAGYQVPNKLLLAQQEDILSSFGLKESSMSLCFDKRLYTTVLSKEERCKHAFYQQNNSREEYLEEILKDLTPDDIRHLIQSEDELTQTGRFMKIFPTPNTHIYHEFFEAPRYYNMMFDAWETKYSKHRQRGIDLLESHCVQKRHLTIPIPGGFSKSSVNQLNTAPRSPSPLPASEEKCEEKPLERRAQSLSSVALYRAARPRSGKLGVVLKPFPRSAYLTRKTKPPTTPLKVSSSTPATSTSNDPEPSSPLRLSENDQVKEVPSPVLMY